MACPWCDQCTLKRSSAGRPGPVIIYKCEFISQDESLFDRWQGRVNESLPSKPFYPQQGSYLRSTPHVLTTCSQINLEPPPEPPTLDSKSLDKSEFVWNGYGLILTSEQNLTDGRISNLLSLELQWLERQLCMCRFDCNPEVNGFFLGSRFSVPHFSEIWAPNWSFLTFDHFRSWNKRRMELQYNKSYGRWPSCSTWSPGLRTN